MWGLVKTPDLYRCGISFAGVNDLDEFLKDGSDVSRNPATREWFLFQIQAGEQRSPQFAAVSPFKQRQKITVPVLFAHGRLDRRVPYAHARRLYELADEPPGTHTWLTFEDEGHGLVYVNNIRWYYHRHMIDFLDRNLGAKPAAPGS